MIRPTMPLSGRLGLARPIALALGLALIGGCVGRSAPVRLYVLTPVPRPVAVAASTEASKGPALGIGPVTLPRYLDRINIVTRRGAEIDVAEFDRWSEALSEGVPRVIGADLAALLGTERVVIFPWSADREIGRQVVIEIARFDGTLGGEVVLEARWRILGPDRKDLLIRYSTVREPTGEASYLSLVSAMSRCLETLSAEIAKALKELGA